MIIDIVTKQDIQLVKEELLQAIAKINQSQKPINEKEWLRNKEVKKLLCISDGTLQNLRTTGKLPFSKIGSISYYKREDVLKMLKAGGKDAK